MFSEFSELYHSLFDEAQHHIAIVRALAKKRKGMPLKELLKVTNLSQGGRVSEIIEELEEFGFVMRMPSFGKETKDRKIRLMDEYTFFYLSWIEGIRSNVLKMLADSTANYWNTIYKTPAWYEWSGHAFENVCLKHINKIKVALGINGVATEESHWHYFPGAHEKGAEIDLVIDRSDDCINLCEMKFCNNEFVIYCNYAEKLERKKEVFQAITKTKKTIFIRMITPFGVIKNEHYIGLVDEQLTMDSLF